MVVIQSVIYLKLDRFVCFTADHLRTDDGKPKRKISIEEDSGKEYDPTEHDWQFQEGFRDRGIDS